MPRDIGVKAAEFPLELGGVGTLTRANRHERWEPKLSKADESTVEPPDDDFVIDAMKQWERWSAAGLGTLLVSIQVAG